jgi:hypothetical protein
VAARVAMRRRCRPVCVDAEPDQPRVCITWYEAEAYAAWRGGALPTRRSGNSPPADPRHPSSPGATSGTPQGERGSTARVDRRSVLPRRRRAGWARWTWPATPWNGSPTGSRSSYYKQEVRDDPTGPEFGSRKGREGRLVGCGPYVGAVGRTGNFEDRRPTRTTTSVSGSCRRANLPPKDRLGAVPVGRC